MGSNFHNGMKFDSAGAQLMALDSRVEVELLASAERAVTGEGAAVNSFGHLRAMFFELDVTAAATAAGDTLDVYVQTTIDGTTWIDIVHFTQVLGNGGAKRFIASTHANLAQAMFEVGSALAAGSVRNIFGAQYRVRWAIAEASAASFTFSVHANGIG